MNIYMKIALEEAKKAVKKNEIPVGAVIVKGNKIIAKAKNNRQHNKNVLGHAEINCILKATKKIKDWRLDKCDMYVTLMPCEMCSAVIKESRINNVYYLLNNEQKKYKNSYIQTNDCEELKEIYKTMMLKFFENLRK